MRRGLDAKRVKLISGLLSADKILLEQTKKNLEKLYGAIDLQSEIIPFDFSDYYNKELGEGILRQYISFSKLVKPEYLRKIKLQTIKLESKFKTGQNRKVNIDPGYLTLDKIVLATTKDSTYRIYLGKGIHAQSTLYFEKGSFRPWSWTYPDYCSKTSIDFFNRVRTVTKKDL